MEVEPVQAEPPVPQKGSSKADELLAKQNKSRRVRKRRCRTACTHCHTRKVRCDFDHQTGTPCNNCRLDGLECKVFEGRRKGPRKGYVRRQSSSADGELAGATRPPERAGRTRLKAQESQKCDGGSIEHCTTDLGLLQEDYIIIEESDQVALSPAELGLCTPPSEDSTKTSSCTSPSTVSDPPATKTDDDIKSTKLPRYIAPLRQDLSEEDVEFLRRKGALTIPGDDLRNELLRSYVEYIDPFMPALELADFMECLTNHESSGSLSLLLFQAVMFAASAMANIDLLRQAGYTDRRSMRKELFVRARLLYDLETELDRVTLIQSVLLMSYWFESPSEQRNTPYWMSIALFLATSIGLHRNLGCDEVKQTKVFRLRKRLWWCCFMRDKLSALAMRRPALITNDDYEIPFLSLHDLDREVVSIEAMQMLSHPSSLCDPLVRLRLAEMCLEKVKLCLCIGRVLEISSPPSGPLSHRLKRFSTSTAKAAAIMKCDTDLQNWRALADECLCDSPSWNELVEPVMAVHRGMLKMLYSTVLITLYLPQIAPDSRYDGNFPQRGVSLTLGEATAEITEVISNLNDLDLVRYLPTSALTVLLPAIVVHSLGMNSGLPETRKRSADGIRRCTQIIERLREIYPSADLAVFFLQLAGRKAGLARGSQSTDCASRHGDLSLGSGTDAANRGNDGMFDEKQIDLSRRFPDTPDSFFALPVDSISKNSDFEDVDFNEFCQSPAMSIQGDVG